MYKSDLKIAVHITHHITGNPKEMIKKDILLKKVINSYLSLSKSVNIFVHLNKKMQLKYKTAIKQNSAPIDIETPCIKS